MATSFTIFKPFQLGSTLGLRFQGEVGIEEGVGVDEEGLGQPRLVGHNVKPLRELQPELRLTQVTDMKASLKAALLQVYQ